MEIDIAKILENAPRGIKLYSPAYGIVELEEVKNTPYCDGTSMAREIKTKSLYSGKRVSFNYQGRLSSDGECILFPGRNGMWNSWQRWLMPQSKGSYVVDCYGGVFRVGENGWSIEDPGGNVFEMSPEDYCKGGDGFKYAMKEEVEFFENNEKKNKKKNKRMIIKCDDGCWTPIKTPELKGDFSKVRLNDKWNYINKEGKTLSLQWFDYVWDFEKGFAIVTLNHRYNFINTEGQLLSPKWFDYVGNFIEGFVRVKLNGEQYYLNTKGQLCDYDTKEVLFASINVQEDSFDNWSIKCAQPGDVLSCENYVFIYKGINPDDKSMAMSFCDCRNERDIYLTTGLGKECDRICEIYDCRPATKEERDRLLSVIKRESITNAYCIKNIIDKASEWLETHIKEYKYCDNVDDLVKTFKKAMEE